MKRKFDHPEPTGNELSGPRYWRSLDELAQTPGFKAQLEREFPEGASSMDGVDRRQFFKLMAASFALGGVGLAGCRRPETHIFPYSKSVEEIIPGLPLYYATAMPLRKSAIPLLAETHQGRPTKLEGNPTFKAYGGATTILAQASILDLYDPDRATTHTSNGTAIDNAAVSDLLAKISGAAGTGAGLAFLAEESSSPTRDALIGRLKKKFPQAIWAEFEPMSNDYAPAAQASFGQSVKPIYRLAKARRVVSIDADFYHSEDGSIYYAREFSKGRRVVKKEDSMNRLYSIESTFTLTGSMADHRLRLASSHMLAFAAALAAKVTGDNAFDSLAQGLDFKNKNDWLEACAADLKANRGASLVMAGQHLPAEVHVVVNAINAALGNVGSTVDYLAVPASPAATISDLATAIKGGTVKTLFILGGNPAYNAPADLDFATLVESVPEVIRFGYYVDETSQLAGTHIAAAHYLESWGDARTADGTIVPVQPMIMPLFNGLTEIEVLAKVAGEKESEPYTLVFNTINGITNGGLDAFRKFLHDGLLEGTGYKPASVRFNAGSARTFLNRSVATAPATVGKESLEVRFTFDATADDGRFANNGWLQECPDPITKISWDNVILVSPKLARELNIVPGDSKPFQVARKELANYPEGKEAAYIGEVTVNGVKVVGPLHIQPGLADWTITLPLGYGRKVSGRVGKDAGHDFYPARTTGGMFIATGAAIRLTGETYLVANTQEHWSMEGRDLVREANLEEVQKEGGPGLAYVNTFGPEAHAPSGLGEVGEAMSQSDKVTLIPRGNSLYKTPDFGGPDAHLDGLHQWGMSIDLNVCMGCNACVIACQAENNIPIVGKQQVLRGREMHWIRIDRYYSDGAIDGTAFGGEGNTIIPEDPQASIQPVACQQCELAPCETVCPVNATVHDQEGINVMAYNRCIGTRYCANNCPYKVRRFNYFDWNKRSIDELYMGPLGHAGMPELVKMVKNPDVTVRMRGVMEKCTYCIQRIQQAKIAQKRKAGASGDVVVPDGTFKVACQQVCPTEAIVFGNLKDPESEVSKAKERNQDYELLGYLNTRPRTTYLGKLRNPNPEMPDYASISTPLSRKEYNNKNGGGEGGEGGHEGHPEHEARNRSGNQSIFGGLS